MDTGNAQNHVTKQHMYDPAGVTTFCSILYACHVLKAWQQNHAIVHTDWFNYTSKHSNYNS